MEVGIGEGAGVGIVGLKTGLRFGFEAAFTETPLFHTNLFPDLTHVYLMELTVEVVPAFEHLLPALTAAFEGTASTVSIRIEARIKRKAFILQRYQRSFIAGINALEKLFANGRESRFQSHRLVVVLRLLPEGPIHLPCVALHKDHVRTLVSS